MKEAADRIFLEGMLFFGYHGVQPEERSRGQRFLVDVELTVDLRAAGRSDDLARTINYSEVYRRVREIVEGPPQQLIETVAETIATALLTEFRPDVARVTVRKPDAPIEGAVFQSVGVSVVRDLNDTNLERS